MHGMADHIENELKNIPYDDILLKFERKILEECKESEEHLRYAGLTDEKIITDLLISEHTELPAEYETFRRDELRKRKEKARHNFLLKGTPVYYLLMIVCYLAVSFLTRDWERSWLIIIGFVTLWVDAVGLTFIREISSKRRLFHPAARVILGLAVMMTTSFIYLIGLIVFRIPDFWVMFPAGVFVMFCADAIFARVTDQKLRIINYLIYVPAAMPMIYVVLCGTRVLPWHPGWLLMPLSVLIDIGIIIGKLIDNRKYIYRPEEG